MGITAGEWFLGIIGLVGVIVGVVVAAMLQSAQGQRVALWEAIAENRKDLANHQAEFAELRGRVNEFHDTYKRTYKRGLI